MIRYLIFTLLFIQISRNAYSQGQYNNWHFGLYQGLTFNLGPPMPITNSAMQSFEGCGTMSDAAGNLLFYTNGNSVWNRNNVEMPNGTGLLGNGDAQQSVLIVPQPGQDSIYYIFTLTGLLTNTDFQYSIVDMSLNGSFGDVTQKNVPVDFGVTEKLTATRHSNGTDFWIIIHPYNSAEFKSYLLTSSGLSLQPVVSAAGVLPSALGCCAFTGAIKVSGNGCWLISTIRQSINGYGLLELFHFNSAAGVVTGDQQIMIPHPYGLEFSHNSSKFYIGQSGPAPILQFDLQAGSDSLILASGVPVSPIISSVFDLQLATNGKIYFPAYVSPNNVMGVINAPNNSGWACQVNSSLFITDPNPTSTLPNNFNLIYNGPMNCAITSIEEADDSEISFYPNPFHTTLSVEGVGKNFNTANCSIYNQLGQIVYTTTINEIKSTDRINIDLSFLPSGIYYFQMHHHGGSISRRIIKYSEN